MWLCVKYLIITPFFSLVWVFVDMPELQEDFIDLKTKKDGNIRPYVRAVPPMAVPDWSFGETGELEWVVLEEYVTKKSNPKIEPELWQRRTLYTKDYWQKFERKLYDEGFKGQDMGIVEYDPRTEQIRAKYPSFLILPCCRKVL